MIRLDMCKVVGLVYIFIQLLALEIIGLLIDVQTHYMYITLKCVTEVTCTRRQSDTELHVH